MKKITVKASDLLEILEAISKEHMDFVELDVLDAEEDDGVRQPAFVNILGVKKTTDEYIVDFGSVDEIQPADLVS